MSKSVWSRFNKSTSYADLKANLHGAILNLKHPYNSRTQHEKCRRILKHAIVVATIKILEWRVVYDLCQTQAALAPKVAYDRRKQKS